MPRTRADEPKQHEVLRHGIGRRLREAREALQLTQLEVAVKAGIDPIHLSRIERGKSWPLIPTTMALCAALGVTADWLLSGRTNERANSRASSHPPAQQAVIEKPEKATKRPLLTKVTLPKGVLQYLALEGDSIEPRMRKALESYDWASLGVKNITVAQVRRFAETLDFDEE